MIAYAETIAAERVRQDRKDFAFRVDGLSPRDEILLKSLVRLLQNVTRHGWLYSPDGQDLLVRGAMIEEAKNVSFEQAERNAGAKVQARLCVGDVKPVDQDFHVVLPLHYRTLEACLNEIGDWLEARAAERSRVAAAAAAAAAARVSEAEASLDAVDSDDSFQLTRWPPAAFLTSPERAKAAALMLKGPIRVSTLARRVGMPVDECKLFVASLPHAVRHAPAPSIFGASSTFELPLQLPAEGGQSQFGLGMAVDSRSNVARVGILSRIRQKLGLK